MGDIVRFMHPAPVRHKQSHGSPERLSFDVASTPAVLREVTSAEMPVGGCIVSPGLYGGEDRTYLHVREGSVWLPLRGEDGGPVPRDRFVGYVEGTIPEYRVQSTDVMHKLARTPLLASKTVVWTRGETLPRRRLGIVVRDGTERARADLVRFVEEDLRVAGGVAYLRVPGPVARWTHATGRAEFRVTLSPRISLREPDIGRHDRIAETWAYLRGARGHCASIDEEPFLVGSDIPDALDDRDDDIALVANAMPASLLGSVGALLAHRTPEGTDTTLIRERAGILRPMADIGQVGGISEVEAADVLRAVSDLCRPVLATYPPGTVHLQDFANALTYAEVIALPRLSGGDPYAGDDMDALSGMGGP